MSEQKHTQGKWEYTLASKDGEIFFAIHNKIPAGHSVPTIAMVPVNNSIPKAEANARLIASCPSMLLELRFANGLIKRLRETLTEYGYLDEKFNFREKERQQLLAEIKGE